MLIKYLPDKTKIFLAAFWIWTWILFWISRLTNYILYLLLTWIPNGLTPKLTQKTPVYILEAKDGEGNLITNKLNLLLNLKWDKEMCDGRGGIDLDKFADYLGTSIIWMKNIGIF
jgi:hypothetical protein